MIAVRVCSQSSCSCESQYEMIDLGDGHYPRYLPVSRCKPKTCQNKFHSCKVLPYMVSISIVSIFPSDRSTRSRAFCIAGVRAEVAGDHHTAQRGRQDTGNAVARISSTQVAAETDDDFGRLCVSLTPYTSTEPANPFAPNERRF